MNDLSIVIVTFREDREVLRACFASVAASVGVTAELIVVDNAGREETAQLLRSIVPEAVYLRNEENRGFAAAVNQGMRVAKGEHMVLLNPDTVLPPDTLRVMTLHMRHDAEVGIASCVIRYPNGEIQESIRRFPTLRDQLLILCKVPHVVPRVIDRYMMRDADPGVTQDVDSIMGAFMLIRRSVLERIGLFDERYFIWFEEVDYCKMAHDAGFVIRHYADAHVVHHKGHMFGQLPTLRKQRWVRQSMRKYFRKHHGILPWLALWLCSPLFIALAHLAAFIKKG